MNTAKHFFICATALVGLAASSPSATVQGADAIPKASQLIDAHFKAVGGPEALQGITNMVLRGTFQEGPQLFGLELAFKAPGMILFTTKDAQGLTIRQGRSPKAILWREDRRGVQEIKDRDLQDVLLGLALALAPFGQLRLMDLYGGAANEAVTVQGQSFWGVRPRSETKAQLWFDPGTGLLRHLGKLDLEDYRSVGKLKMSHRIHIESQGELRLTNMVLNPVLDDVVFAMPATTTPQPTQAFPPVDYVTCLSPQGKLAVVRQPMPLDFARGALTKLPEWNPRSSAPFQVDLRGCDLSGLDVGQRLQDLLHADFDGHTRWPVRLPEGFDPARIQELGKDPGLGVRALHTQGIKGRGIGIGIIDQTLLVNHREYRDRLRLYEEIHSPKNAIATMHGPAVASIALGQNVGVAPAADLYYIAEWHGTSKSGGFEWDFSSTATAIERLLEVNATLPDAKKIRVISISVGWSPDQKGYAETTAAVERAKKQGVFVISTAIEQNYGLAFHGLGREPVADPNQFQAYEPGSWWASRYWDGQGRFAPGKRLLVPMDARTTASPTGPDDYVYYWSGGWSWSVPWIAGLYTLACEVKPDITPERFWAEALRTGRTIRLEKNDEQIEFGTIADPVALITRLREQPPV